MSLSIFWRLYHPRTTHFSAMMMMMIQICYGYNSAEDCKWVSRYFNLLVQNLFPRLLPPFALVSGVSVFLFSVPEVLLFGPRLVLPRLCLAALQRDSCFGLPNIQHRMQRAHMTEGFQWVSLSVFWSCISTFDCICICLHSNFLIVTCELCLCVYCESFCVLILGCRFWNKC